jgi:ABC-2 type transport system ATP-binding protein
LSKVRHIDSVEDAALRDLELKVVTKDAGAILPDLIEVLRIEHVPIQKVSMTRPTLDDVFLKYAGTRLDPNGRASEARQVREMITRG